MDGLGRRTVLLVGVGGNDRGSLTIQGGLAFAAQMLRMIHGVEPRGPRPPSPGRSRRSHRRHGEPGPRPGRGGEGSNQGRGDQLGSR
jgi:hypothetical protein